jgi:hypothetical protein
MPVTRRHPPIVVVIQTLERSTVNEGRRLRVAMSGNGEIQYPVAVNDRFAHGR